MCAHVLRYARHSRTLHLCNGSTRTSRARRMVRRGTMSDFHHFAHSHDGLSPYPHYGWGHLSKAHAARASVCATAACRPNLRCMVHELGSGAALVCANWETPQFSGQPGHSKMCPDGERMLREIFIMLPRAKTNSRRHLKCFRTAKEYSGRRLKRLRWRKQSPGGV